MQKFKEETEAEPTDVPDIARLGETNVPTEASEDMSAATKKQMVTEKKSLQKDVADLEAELQLEAAGRGEGATIDKKQSGSKDGGKTTPGQKEEAPDAPSKTKKKVGATTAK